MSPIRLTVRTMFSLLFACAVALPAAAGTTRVIDLRHDPFAPLAGGPSLFEEGPGAGAFSHDASVAPAWPGDGRGSLAVTCDSLALSSRGVAPLDAIYTEVDDFYFGAVLSVRSDGYDPDPFGFHPIVFELVNSVTTGFDRTGDLSDFRVDTFDALEFAWFPQVSPIFGGPFLSPAAFGSALGDDAFANFAFGSVEVDIPRDQTHLVTVEHHASDQEMIVTLYAIGRGAWLTPIPNGRVVVDMLGLTGFAVDTLAISTYEDGFNIFASSGRSLHAVVDYQRIFFGEGMIAGEAELRSLLGRSGGRSSTGPSGAVGAGSTSIPGGRGDRQMSRDDDGSQVRPRP